MKKETQVETLLDKYKVEYTDWLNILEKYFSGRFDTNYRQYTAYSETKGTSSKISDPLAPEQVERVVQKLFERDPKFFALARGNDLPKEITNILSSIAEYYWTCPERIQSTGTMRSKLKVWGREFCVVGNLGVETYYNSESQTPDWRIIPIEDVIFDPTKSLKTSDVYYIRQRVSLEYLERMVEVEKNGKIVSGIFKKEAIEKIKAKYKDSKQSLKNNPDSAKINRSGDELEQPVNDILLITRYEGAKVCRIVDWEEIVQEYENEILNDDPLDFAMDIEVPKQPYGFSLLDFINGITHAKDLLLNQVIDYGSKALNPPLFVDPSLSPVNRQTLRNAFKVGGIVFASPQQAEHKQMAPLPPAGFQLLNYLQQRAEQASGIGAYLGGVPNQESDKTQGTKGGIEALINQAISPVRDRQQNIEESIIEPMMNKALKYAASLMGDDEIKYILLSGQTPKWVKITKGIMSGKITLIDLMEAEILTEEQGMELAQIMLSEGKDPQTELIFDIDWILRVETGSMAEVDNEKELRAFDSWVEFNAQYGVPQDIMKISTERAIRAGIKEPEQYLTQGGMNGGIPTQGAGQTASPFGQTITPGGVPAMAGLGMQAPAGPFRG